MKWSSIHGVAIFGTGAQAMAFWAPAETHLPVIPADAVSPRPTPPPGLRSLRKREDTTTETFLIGPDQTCGFISGLPGAGYACSAATETCVFMPSSAGVDGVVGCCGDQDCVFRLACYDYEQVSSQSLCDDGCQVDTFTLKCTDSAKPFCNTVSFSDDIFDYTCGSNSITTPQLALTTYSGESDGRTFSEYVFTDGGSTTIPSSKLSSTGSPTGTTSSKSSSPSTDTSSSSSVPTPTAAGNKGDEKSTPVGAIVGGVVGGVAVIGLIGLGIFYLFRRRNNTPTPPTQQLPTTQPPPNQLPGTPGTHQSFYAGDPSKHNSMVQTYPGEPTPPPPFPAQPYQAGAYYQDPNRQDTTSPVSTMAPTAYSHMSVVGAPSPATTHTSYYQPQGQGQPVVPPTVHEMGGPGTGDHRGQMHEIG